MEEALIAYLLATEGLTALVGDRITWVTRPQASGLPAVVLTKVDGMPLYADEGEQGLISARVQVDCWGLTYSTAKGPTRQVMTALSGLQFTQDGVEFRWSGNADQEDSFEEGAGGEKLYRTRLDFIFWHR